MKSEVSKRYKLEKKIQHYFIQALIYLKLPLISLNFGVYNFIPKEALALYHSDKKYININLICVDHDIYHCNKTNDMSNEDFHIFTIFHEIAHYWHDTYHNKHFEKFRESHIDYINMESIEYNKQCLEKHANNIAKVLYKRLYKGDINV